MSSSESVRLHTPPLNAGSLTSMLDDGAVSGLGGDHDGDAAHAADVSPSHPGYRGRGGGVVAWRPLELLG